MYAQIQNGLIALDKGFTDYIVSPISRLFFFDIVFWDNGQSGEINLPIVVVWLMAGAIYFTLRFRFINLRAFRHAVDCVRGRYTNPDESGEISHFQALSAALSATFQLPSPAFT